ncbi:unnamed protein product [Brachionus calyciflorus]|uniref:ADP-ribosylhydrolase ARH1 n=1 Tax=Brachionus calyciflorus TaxID=104777 RepID=A0A814AD12_9BILA|nr:unnamed protein product [Brachionus calyciflorus]
MEERYEACMILHGVGDAMGYNRGKWEFNFSGEDIHKQLEQLGGVESLSLKNWIVSDDTILHLAIAECLIENKELKPSDKLYLKLIPFYKSGMRDMKDRAPGNTTIDAVHKLRETRENGFQIAFNEKGGGCGASMRSPCIGLRFSRPEQKNELIEFAIESGRMTHHHPLGYLGAVAAALFTSYALQGKNINSWGREALKDFELAKNYIEKSSHFPKENSNTWNSFLNPWKEYLKIRKIDVEYSEAIFPEKYGVKERDEFYKSISGLRNWAGSLGLDSVLIAYDALLASKDDWIELCKRAMLHGGDNDSTGCLAGAWYGALYGFKNVPKINYQSLEYKDRISKCGKDLYSIQYLD